MQGMLNALAPVDTAQARRKGTRNALATMKAQRTANELQRQQAMRQAARQGGSMDQIANRLADKGYAQAANKLQQQSEQVEGADLENRLRESKYVAQRAMQVDSQAQYDQFRQEMVELRPESSEFVSQMPDEYGQEARRVLDSLAMETERQIRQTISGEQANKMFGTELAPGAAVTVEGGSGGMSITDVQEPQSQQQNEVKSQFGAVTDEGERITAVRTDQGLFRQTVDEQGNRRLVPLDSSRIRPVETQETGTSQELSGLGSTSKRKLRNLEATTRSFVGTTNELLNRLKENPDANTVVARASGVIEGLREEAAALTQHITHEKPDQKLLQPENFGDEYRELGIQNSRVRSAVQSLAYSLARSREGGRLSESDVRSAIRTLGANLSDPDAFAQTLTDTAKRVVRRTRAKFEAFDQKQPDTDFGLSELPTLQNRQEGEQESSANQEANVKFELNQNGELVRVQ